jgi:hypothetical protein
VFARSPELALGARTRVGDAFDPGELTTRAERLGDRGELVECAPDAVDDR